MVKWYLQHGLRLTAVHQLVEYEPGKPISWFPEEVTGARHVARLKVGLQQTNLAREHPSYLSLNLQAEGVCGLQQSAALFKIRAEKINVAVKVFKRSIMICIFYKDVLDIF